MTEVYDNGANVKKFQGWIASLSNGETVFESPSQPGERTPWGKLIERCERENIWVTQVQLQIAGKTWIGIHQADGYAYFRDYERTGLFTGKVKEKHHVGIGSVIGDNVYCTLINEQLQAQQDVRPLASMRLHCVLKPAEASNV